MVKSFKYWLGIVVLSCIVLRGFSAVLAQEPAISLQEAVQIAKQNNLSLLQQSKAQKSSALNTAIQKTLRLPSLDFSVTSSYVSEVNTLDIGKVIGNLPISVPVSGRVNLGGHDHTEFVLNVRQPVFTGFRIKSQIDLAKLSELSEEAKYDLVSNAIVHSVILLFYRAQSLANQQNILQESMKRLNIQLANVRNLFNAAQVMAFDTLQVYNQTLNLGIEQEKNTVQRKLTELQLARLLNTNTPRPLQLVTFSRPQQETRTLEQLKHTALQNRPELAGVKVALESAKVQQTFFRANYFPTVFVQASYNYAKPALDPVANKWMDYFSAGVNLQWNLWRWGGDRKKVERMQVQANRLTLQQQELQRSVDYEVSDSYENLLLNLREIKLAEHLKNQQAERYRIVSVQHQNGVATTNDLVTAETDLTRSELQYQLVLVQYYVSDANLRLAIGTLAKSYQ